MKKPKAIVQWGNFYTHPTEVYWAKTKQECLDAVGEDKSTYKGTFPIAIIPYDSEEGARLACLTINYSRGLVKLKLEKKSWK